MITTVSHVSFYILIVKNVEVDFVAKFVDTRLPHGDMADLTVTDHNKALNNGAFILRNSVTPFPKASNLNFTRLIGVG